MANPSTQTTNTLITATLWNELVNDIIAQTTRGFSVVLDGGGMALASDTYIDVGPIPISCTITSLTAQCNGVGDLGMDVWKTDTASDAPGSSDTIFTAASDHIIMTCDRYYANAAPVGTMTLIAGDWLRFVVESCADITKATIGVRLTQTFA